MSAADFGCGLHGCATPTPFGSSSHRINSVSLFALTSIRRWAIRFKEKGSGNVKIILRVLSSICCACKMLCLKKAVASRASEIFFWIWNNEYRNESRNNIRKLCYDLWYIMKWALTSGGELRSLYLVNSSLVFVRAMSSALGSPLNTLRWTLNKDA